MTLCHHTPREDLAELLYPEVWIAEHFYLSILGQSKTLAIIWFHLSFYRKNKPRGKVFTKSQAVLQSGD